MDESKLAELEALAAAATPGPWTDDGDAQSWDGEEYGRSWVETSAGRWCQDVPETGAAMAQQGTDAHFIAAARTAVPELVREVRRLRGRNATAEEMERMGNGMRHSFAFKECAVCAAPECRIAIASHDEFTAMRHAYEQAMADLAGARHAERERCALACSALQGGPDISRCAEAIRALPDEPAPEGT